jgi:hypothetical protein
VFEAVNDAPLIDNTAPHSQVPKRFYGTDIYQAVNPAKLTGISDAAVAKLEDDIKTQDRLAIGEWAMLLAAKGVIDLADVNRINSVLTATIPDPAWPAKVPGPSWRERNLLVNGLRADGTTLWATANGITHNFVPLEAIEEARS